MSDELSFMLFRRIRSMLPYVLFFFSFFHGWWKAGTVWCVCMWVCVGGWCILLQKLRPSFVCCCFCSKLNSWKFDSGLWMLFGHLGVLKSNYVGAVKESAHYISLMVAVQQQDLVYFTASTSTTARTREWVGELFHAEGMHKKACVFWYWTMVFLHCSASSRVPIVTANAGTCSWTGSDRSRSVFRYKPIL